MKTMIGLKEFRNNVESVAEKIRKGESFVVLKKSKPIFVISPIGDDVWEEVIDFTKIKKGGVNIKELLARL